MGRVKADLEVIGLVYVFLALCSGSQPGGMPLGDEDPLGSGGTLRVERGGAGAGGRGQCRIRGGQVRVHDDRRGE